MSFEKVRRVRTKHDTTWKRQKGPPKRINVREEYEAMVAAREIAAKANKGLLRRIVTALATK